MTETVWSRIIWSRVLVLIVCLAALGFATYAFASSVNAATAPNLHVGSRGQRVKNLQWLLSGHRPTHYPRFHPYSGRINGRYDRATGDAVKRMKFRLGYPKKMLNRRAGPNLVLYLTGRHKRPIRYIARAASRTRYIKLHPPALTSCQKQIVAIANSQVGVHEVPYGSNGGYFVHIYQAVTGAYNAPWCASFAQWVLYKAHHGPIASRSASVFYIEWWAHARGLLRATPEPGTLVLFLSSQGHMGIVTAVGKTGFTSVEGNYSNAVTRVQHSFSRSYIAFVYLPHCST